MLETPINDNQKKLYETGITLYDSKNYNEALQYFDRAIELIEIIGMRGTEKVRPYLE